MHNQIEPLFLGGGLPSSGAGAVVLDFDDVLFEDKADSKKLLHDAIGQGDIMASAAGVADEQGAESAGFEDAEEFGGGLGHGSAELVHTADVGQVGWDASVGIADEVQIGRVREDQVDGAVGQEGQVADIGAEDSSARVGRVEGKIDGLLTEGDGVGVDVAADIASAQEAAFDEGSAAAGHGVQDELAGL